MIKIFLKITSFCLLFIFSMNVVKMQSGFFIDSSEDLNQEIVKYSEKDLNEKSDNFEFKSEYLYVLNDIFNNKREVFFQLKSFLDSNRYKEPLLDIPISPPEILI
jgi:hypothetical protein